MSIGRAELVANQSNPFLKLLPTRLRQDLTSLSSDVLAAHHAGVTWYLNRRLAETSQTQKELQEERIKRQLERSRTLGSGATREALRTADHLSSTSSSSSKGKGKGTWFEDASSGFIAAAIGGTSPADSGSSKSASESYEHIPTPSEDDEELELSASQILQFEQENADILRATQDTLESVQQAESRLLEISALQMELIDHLTKQTELTDQLYEDAITTTATVEQGNEQLKEAQRRAKDSRLFILVFLVGASLSLLFLHYY
jgi:syntaxin 18